MIDIDVKNFALQGGADPAAELGERDNLVDETRHCRPSHCHLHHCRVGVKGFFMTMLSMRMRTRMRIRMRMINVMARWIPGESNQEELYFNEIPAAC